jgi:ABC-2 type transport system permease protein
MSRHSAQEKMMSASLARAVEAQAAPAAARPTYLGTLGGELFKITHQRLVWVMAILLAGLDAAPYLVYLAGRNIRDQARSDPLSVLYLVMQRDLQVFRVFGGVFLLILAALVIGQEYQLGTIRILLGRGVGRSQLLSAKALALAITALALLVGAVVLDLMLTLGLLLALSGNLDVLQAATPQFWTDTRFYLLSVLISMGATLLLGIGVSVVGRSLAFGIGVGLSWFAADNIAVPIMGLVGSFTHSDFWPNLTSYFLGPLLNQLPALIVPARVITFQGEKGLQTVTKPASALGFQPLVTIDSAHALVVIGVYCIVFAVVAAALTWRRDVLE